MFVAGRKRKLAAGPCQTPGSRSALSVPAPEAEINRWYVLGRENFRERQYRNALDYYNRAVALAANEGVRDAKLYEARAHTLYKLRELTRALADAKEAVRINASSSAGYICIASILADMGKPEEAFTVVKQSLGLADIHASEHKHLQLLYSTLALRLDSTHQPIIESDADPITRLPADLIIMVLRLLDTRMLSICRSVSTRWLHVIDNTPVLWSKPCYLVDSPAHSLARELPAYSKAQKRVQQRPHRTTTPPDTVICRVFERSQRSLLIAAFPDGSTVSAKALEALLACPRPLLTHLALGRASLPRPESISRILSWCLPAMVTSIRLPYCVQVGDDEIGVIAKLGHKLRALDISGCIRISAKRLFLAWNLELAAGAHAVTRIEELIINDHPGIAEFLVYSSKHRHFGKLKVLHAAIRDQAVFSMIRNLGPLLAYFQRIQVTQAPFPDLRELNIDGVWDTTISAHRFESTQLSHLMWSCRLFSCNLRRFSALDSSSVNHNHLQHVFQRSLPSLQQLHLTRAANLDALAVATRTTGAGAMLEPLPLVSLDLSGCVGVTAQGLLALIARCRHLTHVNLSQTAAENSVLNRLTDIVNSTDAPGIEVLVLGATDVTGAAVRDFAAACSARYRRQRENKHAKRVWRLQLLDVDNCAGVGSDAVALTRDLLSSMSTLVLAAI
ncbi:hypothetical protein IWW37_004384 [Coemansia sp. RSA 2050]|nr:hypothetical protein IWW37_004384 [Coemansia sp. RSA 2050]KAJ2731482.1 hypothetical protein IW152_004513 [Coemansia sp. BCRC 34962]